MLKSIVRMKECTLIPFTVISVSDTAGSKALGREALCLQTLLLA